MSVTAKKFADLPHVDASLHYLAPTTKRPRRHAGLLVQDGLESAPDYERCRIRIHDAREMAASLSLEEEGCRLVPHKSAVRNFWDDREVAHIGYPETENLIVAATGARWAFVFDHTPRRRIFGLPDRTPGAPRQPPLHVHVDYTELSAPRRLQELLGAAAGTLLRRRFAVICAWRPIHGPLHDAPLALCDSRSVNQSDLVAMDVVHRDRVGETFAVKHNPAHRWLYFPGMQSHEVLLFKAYDSMRAGTARFVPNTAFEDPSAPADRLIQESIELKAFAFFE